MNFQFERSHPLSPSKGSDQLLSKINNLSKKHTDLNTQSQKIIDELIQVIAQTQKQVDENQPASVCSLIESMHKKLTEVKPLKRMKDEFSDVYKKMSGVVKVLDENSEPASNMQKQQFFNEQQIQEMEQGLAEHYYREGEQKCGEAINEEYQKKQLFSECWRIKNMIVKGEFDEGIEWTEMVNLYQKYKNYLEYELKKAKLLTLVKEQNSQSALLFYQKNMPKFLPEKQEEISMLMGYIMTSLNCYWGSETQYLPAFKNRYERFQQIDNCKLAQEFTVQFYRENGLSRYDAISYCYEVGCQYEEQFMKNFQLLHPLQKNAKQKVLPFAVEVNPKYQFHSLFFCPITKEIYDSKEGGALLECGHIVSIGAIRKIEEGRDNRKAQRCPICQKEITKNSDKKVHF